MYSDVISLAMTISQTSTFYYYIIIFSRERFILNKLSSIILGRGLDTRTLTVALMMRPGGHSYVS